MCISSYEYAILKKIWMYFLIHIPREAAKIYLFLNKQQVSIVEKEAN